MQIKSHTRLPYSQEPPTKKKRNLSSRQQTETDSSLLDDLDEAKKAIDTLLLHLDYQTDPDLIDCYIYQLKSAYIWYQFLLKQIQQTSVYDMELPR